MLARRSPLLLMCFFVFASACEDETKNNSLALVGKWEIVQGFRNQKATGTLNGTYFRFGDDGKMQTNLPIGPEEPVDYVVSRNEIRQKSTPPVKYQIQSLSDSTLVLNLELRSMQFELHFRRAPESEPETAPSLPDTLAAPVDSTLK